MTTEADGYRGLKPLSAHSGLSVRTLRERIADSVDPLPAYRVRGKILVKLAEFDRWIARRRVRADVDAIVDDVLRGVNAGRPA